MKPRFFKSLCAFALLLISALMPIHGANGADNTTGKHFVIAAHEWPPFTSREAKYFGIAPRAVSQILQSQGIDVKYRFMPWTDALNGLIVEEYDGAIVWLTDDIHHNSFLISDPILEHRSALYYRATFPPPKSSDDLIGFRMGINPHYVYDLKTHNLLKEKFIEPVMGSDDANHFRHLLDGKIDFYLTPLLTSAPLLRSQFSKTDQNALTYSTNLFKFPSTHLIIIKDREGSAQFMEKFNAKLTRIKFDGTIERYIDDARFSRY